MLTLESLSLDTDSAIDAADASEIGDAAEIGDSGERAETEDSVRSPSLFRPSSSMIKESFSYSSLTSSFSVLATTFVTPCLSISKSDS